MSNGNRATGVAATHSDEELMGLVQEDDVEAFVELYDRHAARAFGLAREVCRSAELAEDAVEEGFMTIWRSRATSGERRGTFEERLMGVVRNSAVDVIRREWPRGEPEGRMRLGLVKLRMRMDALR